MLQSQASQEQQKHSHRFLMVPNLHLCFEVCCVAGMFVHSAPDWFPYAALQHPMRKDPEDGLLRERFSAATFHDFSRLRFASMSIQCLFAIWCFLVLLFRDQVFVFILEIQSQQFIALSIYPRHGAQLIFVDGGWNNWPSHLHQGHVDESTECASEAQRLSRWRIEDPESSLNSNNTRVGPFLSTATFSCASRGRAILNARHSWYLITTITPCRYLGWSFHILPLIHGFSSACRSVECAWFYFKLVRSTWEDPLCLNYTELDSPLLQFDTIYASLSRMVPSRIFYRFYGVTWRGSYSVEKSGCATCLVPDQFAMPEFISYHVHCLFAWRLGDIILLSLGSLLLGSLLWHWARWICWLLLFCLQNDCARGQILLPVSTLWIR